MPKTSWICGSVCSAKFFGLPPPQMRTPDFPLLLVVPALYVYFDNLAGWSRKVMRSARGESPRAPSRAGA